MRRTTKGGRSLLYRLTILQHSKSSRAARSPPRSHPWNPDVPRFKLDPTPVVELHIFYEESPNKTRDITFLYNANFFLFATIELLPGSQTGNPILTGTPVSGMAYVDRPREAGFFFFNNLRIPYEGRYRLSFDLYEDTKDNADMDPAGMIPAWLPGDSAGEPVFVHRMKIKSRPFTVYPASTSPIEVLYPQGMPITWEKHIGSRAQTRERDNTGQFDEGGSVQEAWDSTAEEDMAVSADRRSDNDLESTVSGVPSLMTGTTISSSLAVAPMETVAKDIVRMLSKDDGMRALFVETPYRMSMERFRRNFLRLFRSFLSDLKHEMHGSRGLCSAIGALKYQSRNIVWHVCSEVFTDKAASDALAQLARQEPDKAKQLYDYITGYVITARNNSARCERVLTPHRTSRADFDALSLRQPHNTFDEDGSSASESDQPGSYPLPLRQLEAAFLQSQSLVRLCKNYQAVLHPEHRESGGPTQREAAGDTSSTALGMRSRPRGLCRMFGISGRLGQAYKTLVWWVSRFSRPTVRKGYRRLEWTCVCIPKVAFHTPELADWARIGLRRGAVCRFR